MNIGKYKIDLNSRELIFLNFSLIFAFENLGIVPDILLVGKALGGGLPLGAFISHPRMMGLLTESPVLGHITTFGGNPVSCAAGHAALKVLQNCIKKRIN